jgi:hypothetical protein
MTPAKKQRGANGLPAPPPGQHDFDAVMNNGPIIQEFDSDEDFNIASEDDEAYLGLQ